MASELYVLIFDAIYGSRTLSLLLYTLDNRYFDKPNIITIAMKISAMA